MILFITIFQPLRPVTCGWWRAGELNPRPRRCERRALPTELAPHAWESEYGKLEKEGINMIEDFRENYN